MLLKTLADHGRKRLHLCCRMQNATTCHAIQVIHQNQGIINKSTLLIVQWFKARPFVQFVRCKTAERIRGRHCTDIKGRCKSPRPGNSGRPEGTPRWARLFESPEGQSLRSWGPSASPRGSWRPSGCRENAGPIPELTYGVSTKSAIFRTRPEIQGGSSGCTLPLVDIKTTIDSLY